MENEYLKKQAWDYFQLHSTQRMTTFNFFIAISSILFVGITISLKNDLNVPYVGTVFGSLLFLFSIVFWKLDQRNKNLIKLSEQALIYFESKIDFDHNETEANIIKLFSYEQQISSDRKVSRSMQLWKNQYSFSECFNIVFILFGAAGIWSVTITFIC